MTDNYHPASTEPIPGPSAQTSLANSQIPKPRTSNVHHKTVIMLILNRITKVQDINRQLKNYRLSDNLAFH